MKTLIDTGWCSRVERDYFAREDGDEMFCFSPAARRCFLPNGMEPDEVACARLQISSVPMGKGWVRQTPNAAGITHVLWSILDTAGFGDLPEVWWRVQFAGKGKRLKTPILHDSSGDLRADDGKWWACREAVEKVLGRELKEHERFIIHVDTTKAGRVLPSYARQERVWWANMAPAMMRILREVGVEQGDWVYWFPQVLDEEEARAAGASEVKETRFRTPWVRKARSWMEDSEGTRWFCFGSIENFASARVAAGGACRLVVEVDPDADAPIPDHHMVYAAHAPTEAMHQWFSQVGVKLGTEIAWWIEEKEDDDA